MPNASDIITYIGIPLAVLGVLPILYTAFNSLLTLSNIKRKLKANGVETIYTASSLMSGMVEVSLPRFSISPLDRDEDGEYWTINPQASSLKGASWTSFNWNSLITGSKLYRLQYSEDLRLPQAEISFEDLISFLLDRGAVPDVKGLRLFRMSGLWTPIGTSLMLSPDTTQSALRISLPDDSDGVISLALTWSTDWDNYRMQGLRPGWMRVQCRKQKEGDAHQAPEAKSTDEKAKEIAQEPDDKSDEKSSDLKANVDEVPPNPKSLRLRFSHTGRALTISKAVREFEGAQPEEPINLEHLDVKPGSFWIPAIALALGISRSLPLYHHNLDESLEPLALRETMPCGVLVMHGILGEADAPSWETKYDPFEDLHAGHSNFLEERRAEQAEKLLPPAQQEAARRSRLMARATKQGDDFRAKMQRDKDRKMNRAREAIASPRLGPAVVAKAALRWLQGQELVPKDIDLQGVIEGLVVGLMEKEEEAMKVCGLLASWEEWSKRAGMTIDNVFALGYEKAAFCSAACVIGILNEVFTREESRAAEDMKECIRHWKTVKLG